MKLSQIMKGPRLKVERANYHINTLIRDCAVMPAHLYEVSNGQTEHLHPITKQYRFALTYRPKQPIPEHYGAIMGDAVNNLREALDYWIRGATMCVGPRRKLHFPFAASWEALKTSKNYGQVERTFPDAAKFISEQIKPCRDTNLHLWAAASLCNDNKHDDFLPVTSATEWGGNVTLRAGNISMQLPTFVFDANRPLNAVGSDGPMSIENEFKVSATITFPKGAIFENEPVIPTLLHMSQVVSQTLDMLEEFITPYAT